MSTKQTHTAGPWKIVQEHVDPEWHIVTARGGRIMANVHIETGNAMDAANARLIALAPEMAEALREAPDFFAGGRFCQEHARKIRAILAKLDGDA